MNFAEFHKNTIYNTLIKLKNAHALGRSLVIFKTTASRS
ncbi:preprotein translocase subunit SecY [Escherichia coli]|nr:preprotein translocase subunit SecY [Escherichia coli]